ncbi:glycosyltransferase family 1 protein [Virgibacillus flavescens]|uniref:glycosyltransferase family 1 protein n=1 Tax=Virgibacillus flavescens TaxID=1611422 RepID=UPI003D32DDB2
MEPKRILHVVGAMNRAGTETMLMNIYRNIERKHIQFDFISYSDQEAHYDEEIIKLGGRVIKLANTRSIKEIYDAIKHYGPYEAVHCHTLFHCGIANLAALLAGVKIRVSHAHTTSDKSDSYMRKVYIHSMRNLINTFSTHLLACSYQAGKYLFGEKGVNTSKYSFFANVIDYQVYLKEPKKNVAAFKVENGFGSSLVIGHIGRFIESKNHVFLMEVLEKALRKDATIKLLLVGDGDQRIDIERKAKAAGLWENILFAGIREDISTMMHSMDVFVFPSKYEGLGLVLLEAQASGLPCIVSESIQPEADLGIGIFTKLKLSDGPEVWVQHILVLANKKEKDATKISRAFEKNGYALSEGISQLMNMYNCSEGEVHEKSVNRLF